MHILSNFVYFFLYPLIRKTICVDLNLHLLIAHLKNIKEYIPKKEINLDLEKMKLKLSQYSTSVYNNICLIENQNSTQKAQSSTNTFKVQIRTQNGSGKTLSIWLNYWFKTSSGSSFVKSETGCHTWMARRDQRKRQMGFNKQVNLHTSLALGSHKILDILTCISESNFYTEVLNGFSHIYGPKVSTQHYCLKATSLK